jgi:predicted nucleic acid-binding Zn ribbon protein
VSRPAPRPVAALVHELERELAPTTTLGRAQQIWERAVGAAIAAAAQPTAEREGILTVSCEAAVWAQELDLMAGELIPRLNALLGSERIHELRCRTG